MAEAHVLEAVSPDVLLTPAQAMRDLPVVAVSESERIDVGHGKALTIDDRFRGDGPWSVVDDEGRLLAVYIAHRAGTAKPDVVVAPVDGR